MLNILPTPTFYQLETPQLNLKLPTTQQVNGKYPTKKSTLDQLTTAHHLPSTISNFWMGDMLRRSWDARDVEIMFRWGKCWVDVDFSHLYRTFHLFKARLGKMLRKCWDGYNVERILISFNRLGTNTRHMVDMGQGLNIKPLFLPIWLHVLSLRALPLLLGIRY